MDIYLLDAISGKKVKRLIKGNRSIDFEELKFLQPGINWSPDSKKIVIAAKAGSSDALYLIDVKSGKQEKIPFELDGVFTAAWSPDGNKLAFVGNEGGASDIYSYDLVSKELNNLTNDVFSDTEPSWSPDGSKIVFASDRGKNVDNQSIAVNEMISHNYSQKNIYTINLDSKKIVQITDTEYNENYPIFSNTKNMLLYTADYQGTWNLFHHDLDSGESKVVTNLLTGLFQLSLTKDDGSLVFSGYSGLGWDVYRLNNPLNLDEVSVKPTNYIANRKKNDEEELADLRKHKRKGTQAMTTDYSSYIFAYEYEQYNDKDFAQDPITLKPDSAFIGNDGEYIPQVYKTKFSLDIAQGSYGYNNVFGHQGVLVF